MLERKHRLRKEEDIKKVLRLGRRTRTPLVLFSLLQHTDQEPARIAVVVGKRVHKSAFARHRIQRILREIAREVLLQYSSGYDMVVVAEPSLATARKKSDFKTVSELLLKEVSDL